VGSAPTTTPFASSSHGTAPSRVAFNRTVVLRYRIHLEQRRHAPATINLRLAAVRRIAYEAADTGLLSPELAAGIRRVKGVRRIGVRLGNWLTPEQGRRLLAQTDVGTPRARRDRAMLAMLIGCRLRRGELLTLTLESIQQREDHWVIADLVGKGRHVRTLPIPARVKTAVDEWTVAAGITDGVVFRAINKAGRVWGSGMSPKVLWDVVKAAAARAEIDKLAPHDLPHVRETVPPGWRRTRPDPVPPGARLDPDDGALPGMQEKAAVCRERSARDRASYRSLSRSTRADTPDIRPSRPRGS
jgi:integrase